MQYIGWSILYIPLGYIYIASLALPVFAIPLAIIVGLCYSGIWYHLWYIPAFLFGIYFVNKLNQYMKMRMVFLISLILYLIGSVETYYSYLQGTFLHQIYEQYRVFFLTSRNGLFYVPIFICVGYLIAQEKEVGLFSKQFFKMKCLLALGCLVLEGTIIYMNQGIDKNFMFSFIPVTGLLFIWAKHTSIWQEKQLCTLKQLSIYYFFIHPLFIEMAALFSEEMGQSLGIHEGWVVFIFTLVATHLTAYSILKTGVVERIKIKLRTVAIFIKKNARKHSQINT
nr:hypothetical protein [Marinilactibacillus kalidii]